MGKKERKKERCCGISHPVSDAVCRKDSEHTKMGDSLHEGWATTFGGSMCYWMVPSNENADDNRVKVLEALEKDDLTEEEAIQTIEAIEAISQQDGDGASLLEEVDAEMAAIEAELEAAGPVKVKF